MRLHRQGLAVALAMRVVCALAWAQEIEFHASFEEAQAAAREHQQFIMVVVTAPEAPHHKRMTEEILTSGPIVELVRQYFAPVMINLEDVRAGKTKLPAPIKAKYTKGNQIHMPIPAAVFYDREGKQIEKLAEFIIDQKGTKKWFDLLPGGLQPEAFHSVLKTISAKVAEAVPPKERRDVARALQQGQAAFERKDYRTARAALKAVVEGGVPGEQLDLAERMLRQIDEKALVKLEDGKAHEAEERLGSAIRAYRACVRDFQGSKPAEEAAARLKAFRGDRELRQRIHDRLAARLVAQAEKAIERGRYGEAGEALQRVLDLYADGQAAAKAKALREKLESDPDIKAEIREAEVRADADRLLRLADGYRRNKMLEKALATYQQVVAKYPNTRFAATAEGQIAELRATLER